MPKKDRYRALYVFKYLWENADEKHPATLAQIRNFLGEIGIGAIPKTIDSDITALQELGFDIIRNRSTQYQYFFASRDFSTSELKLMIDAVQAARFIPRAQSEELIRRIAALSNRSQAADLRRNLYVSKLKENDKNTLIAADWLNTAINQNKKVSFQYYEYNRDGKKVLKHEGRRYIFSPYALVWNMDNYYAVGSCERDGKPKIMKFRVDKICGINIENEDRVPCPETFDLAAFCDSMFLMYGDQRRDVTLCCEYGVMSKIIDRFGENISIMPGEDSDHFRITESVMACSTFYSWVFNYGGKIKIVAPEDVKRDFEAMLHFFES